MKKQIHPAFVAIAIVVTLVLAVFLGSKTIKEPDSAVGVGADGKEMTREQGEAMGRAMRGAAGAETSKTETPVAKQDDKTKVPAKK